jgi:L-fucose mutarotase/ribose pyranase (RbsD/FucU family)
MKNPGIADTHRANDWERQLQSRLTVFGHRNWIVLADAAYPEQSNPGIETIVVAADPFEVIGKVLEAITQSAHVRANVYIDAEMQFVEEGDAPGINNFRFELAELLNPTQLQPLPHEEIIAKLDQAAKLFRVLIVKTRLTIPYTSVFFELDCGYWSAEAEARLRRRISAAQAG